METAIQETVQKALPHWHCGQKNAALRVIVTGLYAGPNSADMRIKLRGLENSLLRAARRKDFDPAARLQEFAESIANL